MTDNRELPRPDGQDGPGDGASPQGSAAASRSSVADQTTAQLGGSASLLVRQRRDHALLDELLDALARTSVAEQDEVLTRIGRLVFPHAYAEETVVWPVLRAVLSDGDQLTLRNEQEHQEINELFSELDGSPVATQRRTELLTRLDALLRRDVRDEEDLLLPRLQGALTVPQLRTLGWAWEMVRRTAPTRPHAVVSRRPPGNLLSGIPLSALDRSRDALERSARRWPALSSPLSTTSRALAVLAGRIEHAPPLTRGERPSTRAHRTGAGS